MYIVDLYSGNEGLDQTARMRSLIRAFIAIIYHKTFVVLLYMIKVQAN